MEAIISPVLHLPLDELRYSDTLKEYITPNIGTVKDDSRVLGNPWVAQDPQMGGCLTFNGETDWLEVPSMQNFSIKNGVTIAAWVKFDALQNWGRIIDINAQSAEVPEWNSGIYLSGLGNSTGLRFCVLNTMLDIENVIVTGAWIHIAATYDPNSNELKIYINGDVRGKIEATALSTIPQAWQKYYVGKSSWVADSLFKGVIADIRVYESALPAKSIKNIMVLDKTNMAAFRNSYPVEFELYSVYAEDHKPVIYIEATGKSEPLELAFTNITNKKIEFDPQIPPPDNDNFHIQLRFRKNVVSSDILDKLRNKKLLINGWNYTVCDASEGGREDWISFVYTGNLVLNKAQAGYLNIPEFSASTRGGARNTRVEIRFANLVNERADHVPYSGSVIRHMEIQSHLGLKSIPLMPVVVGSNTILNDGVTKNELTIHIVNTQPGKRISFLDSIHNAESSRFELIASNSLIINNAFSVNAVGNNVNVVQDATVDIHYAVIKVAGGVDSGFMEINITDWITNASSGMQYLRLRYENIPGFQDGEWLIAVQFGPIIIRNIDDNDRVGIGTDEPRAKLHVVGSVLAEGTMSVHGSAQLNAGVSINKYLNIEGNTDIQGDIKIQGLADIRGNLYAGKTRINGDILLLGKVEVGDVNIVKDGKIYDKNGYVTPTGAIIAYAGAIPPDGWLLCNGAIVYEHKYPELYGILKPSMYAHNTTSGKNEVTTPDLTDRFILGLGRNNADNLGKTGGAKEVILTEDQMPRHRHNLNMNGNFQVPNDGSSHNVMSPYDPHGNVNETEYSGNNQPHNNMPPYCILSYIIKY